MSKDKKDVNFKTFLRKNTRKMVTMIIITVTILVIISPLFIKNIPIVDENTNKLEMAENIAQVLAALFVIIGTFIAVWQYYISSKSEIIKLETDKVQKAIELSGYYKDEVLYPYSIIRVIYEKAGIFDFLQQEKNKMNDFDVDEMREIFSQTSIKELEKKYSSKEFIDAMAELNEILNLHINGCTTESNVNIDGDRKTSITININKALNDFHVNYITKLLNNMEQFAMYFTHNVADESVVYQSLYPTYIEICRTLYYDISICSEPGAPKLYRNLQSLYKTWLEKSNLTKQYIRAQETQKGTIPENIR